MQKEFTKTDSSAIDAYHYDADAHELTIRYPSGHEYVYHAVTPDKFKAFEDAESKGKHLNAHIKPHHRTTGPL